ncbi:MAG: DUF4446 family protein [Marmoricola sp.]
MTVVAVLALLLALAALGIAVVAARRTARTRPAADADLPDDVLGLRQEVAGLRLDIGRTLRHLAVVRYDAFGDMGGQLSWSVALLDDGGDGLVLTSIHGRSDARTYAKSISGWACEQPLSPEEEDVLEHARP